MRRFKAGIISVLMMFSLLMTGCDQKKIEAPELIESVAVNEAYRPVSYGNVGNTIVKDGVVVPVDYCHFWAVSVGVDEIKVNVGDYVNQGDVIAIADIDQANEALEDLQEQLTLLNTNFSLKEDIYEYDKKELEYCRQACFDQGDSEGVAAYDVQLSVLEENFRYDKILYNRYVSDYEESIGKQREIISDGTMVARKSGYVTYVKDLSLANLAMASENVVVISDYNDCYIEITGVTVRERLLKTYPIYYTVTEGEKIKLKEYEYSAEELVVCQGKGMSPALRLKYVNDDVEYNIGDNIPVFMNKELFENVLVVGKDSLYKDSTGEFVYVKTETGKEVRYIEVGAVDDYSAQVLSGLEEGEMVYYSSEAMLPESYVEYEVDFSDFSVYQQMDNYDIKNTKKTVYYSEYEGQVTEVLISEEDYVNQGQVICKIKTNEGSAALTEMRNNIQSMKDSQEALIKGFDEQIALYEEQIENYGLSEEESTSIDSEPDVALNEEDIASDSDAKVEKENPYGKEILICQLEKVKINKKISEVNFESQLKQANEAYNKESCNNDGTGTISIRAEKSGYLKNVNVRTGKNMEIGDKLFAIESTSKTMISFSTNDNLTIGRKLTFYDKNTEEKYIGIVCGTSGDSAYSDPKEYISTIDGKVYITSSIGESNKRYYVLMEDESFYEKNAECLVVYPTKEIYHTVVIPKKALFSEEQINTQEKSYFVWKIVDGSLVKQYVIYAGQNSAGDCCIINGLKKGDVLTLVGEKDEEAED